MLLLGATMPAVLVPCGEVAIRCGAFMDSRPFLSLAPSSVDIYCPPLKRLRVTAPLVAPSIEKEPAILKPVCSMDTLPDECLFEILRRIDVKEDRSVAACVSRRWLMLLSTIRRNDAVKKVTKLPKSHLPDLNEDPVIDVDAMHSIEVVVPELARCLEGRDATDAKLAAVAIKSGSELDKLSIRSNMEACLVTDAGLKAVARCCPSLRTLMVWDASFISDDGLLEIAEGCKKLEKLDLCQCPAITDKGIIAIVENCPDLVSLTIESCPKISDKTLEAVGQCCPKLQAVSIACCPLVSDRGVSSLVSATSSSLKRIRLQSLNVTDVSLGVVGYYCKEVVELVLGDLPNVCERGFWVMGSTCGLQKLNNFMVSSCDGLTDRSLEAIAKTCPFLKQLTVRRSLHLSDLGLKAFAQATRLLETVRLEECSRITMTGIVALLVNCHDKLKALSISRCSAIAHMPSGPLPIIPCVSLRSLAIRKCAGFGDSCLSVLAKFCPGLQQLDMRGLPHVTSDGLLELITLGQPQLMKVNLNGCTNITDVAATAIAKIHGRTLEALSLEGCRKITDESLSAIVEHCSVLKNLDISLTAVSDAGISMLSSAKQLSLSILSLAHCDKISNRSLSSLCNFDHSLVGLNLQNCSMISASAVSSFEDKLWRCDVLF